MVPFSPHLWRRVDKSLAGDRTISVRVELDSVAGRAELLLGKQLHYTEIWAKNLPLGT